MYTTRNFKTKKEFKAAVDAYNAWQAAKVDYVPGAPTLTVGAVLVDKALADAPRPAPGVTYYQPGPFGGNEPRDGVAYFEGPHYPQAHKWYAKGTLANGVVVKVS
jgi:hypothetical protein